MEAVKILECSRDGLSGVWGVERSEGSGGNWGGPPRPNGLRGVCCWSVGLYNRSTPGNEHRAGWASEAAVVLVEPSGQHNRR